jgi:phage terminase large subunit-like protein
MRREWLCHYKTKPQVANCVILVDPAGERKQGVKGKRDNSAIGVVGIGADGNKYLMDGYRARYNLEERTNILFDLHRKYRPNGVFYERYGMQTDLVYIRNQMELLSYRFQIFELGGSLAKEDRIRRLIGPFSRGQIWLPETLFRTNTEGETRDIIQDFIEIEYLPFPVGEFDDFFDMLSRMEDEIVAARLKPPKAQRNTRVRRHRIKNRSVGY